MTSRFLALAAVAVLVACAPKAEFAQVLDGNTVQLKGKVIRLQGVDAPQLAQRCGSGGDTWKCGAAAREELIRVVGKDPIHCDILSRDTLNRAIGHCTAGGRDLGLALIAGGFAKLDTNHPAAYEAAEAEARDNGRGVWAPRNHAAAPGAVPSAQ